MAQYDYDLFTIGAGSAGVRASRMSAFYGAKVAVAEERYLGGTCVNVGCIPKKLLVYAAHFGEDFEDAAGFGRWLAGLCRGSGKNTRRRAPRRALPSPRRFAKSRSLESRQ